MNNINKQILLRMTPHGFGRRLVYYKVEKLTFPEAFKEKVNFEKAEMISKKLIRHFKLINVEKVISYFGSGATCRYWKSGIPYCEIVLPKTEMSIGLICHELGHAFELLKYRKATHSKKHTKLMKRLINYCQKKNYWREEEMEEIESI